MTRALGNDIYLHNPTFACFFKNVPRFCLPSRRLYSPGRQIVFPEDEQLLYRNQRPDWVEKESEMTNYMTYEGATSLSRGELIPRHRGQTPEPWCASFVLSEAGKEAG